MISVQVFNGGRLEADWTGRIVGGEFSTNEHGCEAMSGFVPMSEDEAFIFYNNIFVMDVWVMLDSYPAWRGRLEDVRIVAGGIEFTAFGYWRAFSDDLYTALWSKAGVADFQMLTGDDYSFALPDLYESDNNNRLYLAPRNGESFTSFQRGDWAIQVPNGSKNIVAASFEIQFNASSNWGFLFHCYNENWDWLNTIVNLAGNSLLVSRAYCLQISGFAGIGFLLYRRDSAGVYTGETGETFLKIANVRIATSTENFIDTTLTAAVSTTGSSTTATVGSTAGMYARMELTIDSGNADSEMVVVESVDSPTTFTATFANTHSSGESVRAIKVTADEIATDLTSQINALNSSQINENSALIQSPNVDLFNAVYEDALPAEILTHLAAAGDDGLPPQRYAAGVWTDQRLYFQPRGEQGIDLYVDAVELEVERTVETMINSAYGLYSDANGRILRTADAANGISQQRHGITRRRAIEADTSSNAIAENYRDALIEQGQNTIPRAALRRLVGPFTQSGGVYPRALVRSGDRITIRNLPADSNSEVDKIRTFVISRTQYSLDSDELVIVPESPLPEIEYLLADS